MLFFNRIIQMGSKTPTFFELCRLCLDKSGEIGILTTKELAEDIFKFTSVKVSEKDKLPTRICLKCLETIYSAKNLKEIALQNDISLHSLFEDDDEDELSTGCDEDMDRSDDSGNEIRSRIVFEDDNMELVQIDKNKRKKRKRSSKHNKKSEANKKISVRKDLFQSSSVTSSTNLKEGLDNSESNSTKNSSRSRLSSADKNYECSECGKTFDTRKKFKLHQRTHNKTFFCPLDACGKKFATKGDVEKHMRTHTGERPYTCQDCDKKFAQRGTLKAHKEAMHGTGSSVKEI